MRGFRFSTDHRLPERDMIDLADTLAVQIHETMGHRVYLLSRIDVRELITPYIDDLTTEDQCDLAWIVWHLFQEAYEMEQRAA